MSGLGEIIMNDTAWVDFVDECGPVVASAELRRLLKILGQQEHLRVQGLAAATVDPDVEQAHLDSMRANLKLWKRSIARIRTKAQQRLSSIRPSAQAIIDSHQADRRALVVLAKRIWLWEEGLDDRLDEALDDFTISTSTSEDTGDRITLRALITDIQARGQEVTP